MREACDMTELNYSNIAPEIAAILLCRGSAVPPLSWSESPCKAAWNKLDSLSDGELLSGALLKNRPLLDSLRALLFLRNGWLIECHQLAHMLPEKLRWYLSALVERHQGNTDKAKLNFQNLNGHPVFHRLASCAIERYEATEDQVKHFISILKMNGTWEPYAFCDLVTRALDGKLSVSEKQSVCELQLDEFHCLFAYCYEEVTGVNIEMNESESVTEEIAA